LGTELERLGRLAHDHDWQRHPPDPLVLQVDLKVVEAIPDRVCRHLNGDV